MVNTVIKLPKIHSLWTRGGWRLWGSNAGKHTPSKDIVSVCIWVCFVIHTCWLVCSSSRVCCNHVIIALSESLTRPHEAGWGVVTKCVFMMCAWSCVTAVCQRWWRCLTRRVRATCTGYLLPACDLAQAPAHSLSPAEGCGGSDGEAGVSSPSIHSDAKALGLTKEGQGRGWCGWTGGCLAGRQSWDWRCCWCLWWWSRRKGADWSCEPGCSEPSWAQSSTDGGRKGREERQRADLRKQRGYLGDYIKQKLQLPWRFCYAPAYVATGLSLKDNSASSGY